MEIHLNLFQPPKFSRGRQNLIKVNHKPSEVTVFVSTPYRQRASFPAGGRPGTSDSPSHSVIPTTNRVEGEKTKSREPAVLLPPSHSMSGAEGESAKSREPTAGHYNTMRPYCRHFPRDWKEGMNAIPVPLVTATSASLPDRPAVYRRRHHIPIMPGGHQT